MSIPPKNDSLLQTSTVALPSSAGSSPGSGGDSADAMQSTLSQSTPAGPGFSSAELGALSHLYRGEMYRSKIWRTRLDTTTNWAVGVTGITLSVTLGDTDHSPIVILVVGILVLIFLLFEARRYRYFDIWRTRVRLLEVCLFGPILRRSPATSPSNWNEILASDYEYLRFHISFSEAIGRRLRRNYIWIFIVLGIAYLVKLVIHPVDAESLTEFMSRAAIGPVPGALVLCLVSLAYCAIFGFALGTIGRQEAHGRVGEHQAPDKLRTIRF